MKLNTFSALALSLIAIGSSAADSAIEKLIEKKGTLIFQDDFNRSEADDTKEQLGAGWVTNSEKRAAGAKQGNLKDGYLRITMAKHANHGVSIRHDAPFDDGVVKVRFRMHDAKGIGFNFNDPKCKESHAGHICHVGVKPKKVDFRDGKTGVFDLEIRKKRLAGASKAEISKLIEGTQVFVDVDLETGKWYEMTLLIQGAKMSAYVDGAKVGEIVSEGVDHPVKQNMAFSVSGTTDVDDLRIWSLATE